MGLLAMPGADDITFEPARIRGPLHRPADLSGCISSIRTSLRNSVRPRQARRTRALSIDTAVAQRCARLHVPDPKSDRDALIAATALVHGMTVVTRNTDGFATTGVPLINPWFA